jgi:hypothetical protein
MVSAVWADIHKLFDLGQIQIDTQTLTFELSDGLLATQYVELKEEKLRLPNNQLTPMGAGLQARKNFRIRRSWRCYSCATKSRDSAGSA